MMLTKKIFHQNITHPKIQTNADKLKATITCNTSYISITEYLINILISIKVTISEIWLIST